MTKKELLQLKHLNKEIELIQKQILNAENTVGTGVTVDSVRGSSTEFPYTQHTIHIEGIDTTRYEKQVKQLKRRLNLRLQELIKKRDEIEEYIYSIPDSLIRQVLSLRYVKGLSWQQVANRIGGNTANSVRMMHNRFLSKN